MAIGKSSLHRPRRGRRNSCTIMAETKTEAYSYCYYYYNIFEKVSNIKLIDDYDDLAYSFVNLCDQLEKTDRLKSLLTNEISKLEKDNLLVRYAEPYVLFAA